jgi:hypothetical protein
MSLCLASDCKQPGPNTIGGGLDLKILDSLLEFNRFFCYILVLYTVFCVPIRLPTRSDSFGRLWDPVPIYVRISDPSENPPTSSVLQDHQRNALILKRSFCILLLAIRND